MGQTRRRLLFGAAAAAALPALRAEPAAAQVDIRDRKFLPEVLSVKVGTTVRWTNDEKRTTHSVRFPAEGGLESERLFPGDSWQRRFDKPGIYPYTCGPHPEMKGLVEVEGVSFDRMVNPADDHRLHQSDWVTGRVTWAVRLAIVRGVDKARIS